MGMECAIQEFRAKVSASVSRIKMMHSKRVPAAKLIYARVQSVDAILKEIWQQLMVADNENDRISLVAVGGYGRQELNPCSDIDILLLHNNECMSYESIENFVRFLWDIGFDIGHSVRTLSECVQQSCSDITVMTNLLDSRLCAGSQELFQQLEASLNNSRIWSARQFYEAKLEEQKQRHHKYADIAFNLEPNIKDGPGGLRDIHTIQWIAKRCFGSSGFDELVTRNILLKDEYRTLVRGRNYLWKLRNELHFVTERCEDRLLFPYQLQLANRFELLDDNNNKAVEKLMKPYFRTVKELRHINSLLLQHFEETMVAHKRRKIVNINENFNSIDGYLEFAKTREEIETNPAILIEACIFIQNNPSIRGVRTNALRLMRSRNPAISRFLQSSSYVQSLVFNIFRNYKLLPDTLRLMDDTGLLGRIIPEFKRATGELQYDLFHVYTVDAHLLNVVWHLHQLTESDTAKTLPIAHEVMQNIVKPERLFIAALFHDIAKGQGGDHSQLGESSSYRFCRRIGMSEYDSHFVAWLVRHHLAMSYTSQREDLNDSQVITRFAAKVGNQEHLDNLFLLTIADMRGTGPNIWNSWKGNMLAHLYRATTTALLFDKLPHDAVGPRVVEIRSDSLKLLSSRLRKVAQKYWNLLDDDYFLSYDASTIAWHVAQSAEIDVFDVPFVSFRSNPLIDVIQVFVLAANTDELFTIIAGTLDHCCLNVVEARIHPLTPGLVIISFVVLSIDNETSEQKLRHFETEVRNAIIQQSIEISPRLVTPNRIAKHMPYQPKIRFSHSPGMEYTILAISAEDRPGLLYLVVKVLLDHKIHLLSAKITTSGARAQDVFFVVDRDGNHLAAESIQRQLTDDLLKVLSA